MVMTPLYPRFPFLRTIASQYAFKCLESILPCDCDRLRLRELLNIASDHTAPIAANCEDLASPRQLACLKVFERRPGAMPYMRVHDTVQASSNGTTTCCPSSSKQGREAAIRFYKYRRCRTLGSLIVQLRNRSSSSLSARVKRSC